eukprot:1474171-Amphidinium_carterae.1
MSWRGHVGLVSRGRPDTLRLHQFPARRTSIRAPSPGPDRRASCTPTLHGPTPGTSPTCISVAHHLKKVDLLTAQEDKVGERRLPARPFRNPFSTAASSVMATVIVRRYTVLRAWLSMHTGVMVRTPHWSLQRPSELSTDLRSGYTLLNGGSMM